MVYTLVYTFTPADGSDAFSITKDVGLSRINKLGETALPALYEFYNVFPAGTLKEDIAYDVFVQAYDRNNDIIDGFTCTFTLKLSGNQSSDFSQDQFPHTGNLS